MNILALSGSLRRKSFNTALLRCAKNIAGESLDISIYDSLGTIPPFNAEIVEKNTPQTVVDFRSRIANANGVFISTPEYAHGVPGVLKNALDWVVASGELVLKPVLVTSVSTTELGGLRAHSALVMILSAMNANVLVSGSLNVPFAKTKFNVDGELADSLIKDSLKTALGILGNAIRDSG